MVEKKRDCSVLYLSVLLFLNLFPLNYCLSIYNITQTQPLLQGQTLVSESRIFELGFFSLNNSDEQYVGLWYKQISPRRIVWVANRESPLVVDSSSPASLRIGPNGNLELINGNKSSLIWSTGVKAPSNGSVIAVLLDNGDFVLRDSLSGVKLWESFYHPTDTFLPGGVLGFNAKTGEKYALTSWKASGSDPSPGKFSVGIAPHKPPELFVWMNGTIPLWRSGPWDKSRFVGIPGMSPGSDSQFDLVEDEETGITSVIFRLSNTLDLLYISPVGRFTLVLDVADPNGQMFWEAPAGPCDDYGFCGPNGVCIENYYSAICECLNGFEPKSYEEWNRENRTSGCVRKKGLSCNKDSKSQKSDGFHKMGNVKIPDFYEYVIPEDAEPELKSCQRLCLNNCSCLAFSYVESIGCLVWFKALIDIHEFSEELTSPYSGVDLYIRLADTEFVAGRLQKTLIISVSVISAAVVIGALTFWLHKQRATRKKKIDSIRASNESGDVQFSKQHDQLELPIFEFGSVLVATDNFNVKNKLGQGGFGSVYKGKLPDGKEIAVKRLSSSSVQGIEEFKNEILLISKLQHRNLVKLFGCCIEKEEKLLIYELMPNKSLDFFIFDQKRREQLTWATRFSIIHGVAKGILYLHRDSCLRVIHRDLKASNILLDEKMNPKISDFGLARMFQGTVNLVNTHRVAGTLGYMSPEYAMSGIFSEKSDVFSFGVLLLEIVSGRKNTDFHYRDQQLSLITYAWHLWSEQRAIELVDGALKESSCSAEMMRCVHVGLLCVQDRDGDRPSMPDVVFMLSNETDRPPPKQPIFTFQSYPKGEIQPNSGSKCSINYEDSISIVEGR